MSDLAAAHVLAIKRLDGTAESDIFNIGIGRGYSVKEVIAAARTVTGKPIACTISPRRPGDPPELVCDPSKATRLLGWQAERSPLEIQVADAWRWIQDKLPELADSLEGRKAPGGSAG